MKQLSKKQQKKADRAAYQKYNKSKFESEKRYRFWKTVFLVSLCVVIVCVVLLIILEKQK